MLKFGIVSEIDPAKGMAKIKYDENDGMVSPWLFIGVRNTKENKEELWFDENEHVAALLTPDMRCGIIIYSIYDADNAPENGDQDIWVKKFKDGTTIGYHRGNHKLVIDGDSNLEVEINAGHVEIDADTTDITGDLNVGGDLDVSGSIHSSGDINSDGNISANGNVNAQGSVAAQADVTAGGGVISLIGHKHLVTSAPGTTGPSIP